jgi:hypothetical protein
LQLVTLARLASIKTKDDAGRWQLPISRIQDVDYQPKWEKKANRKIECQGTKTSQSDIFQNVGKRAKLLHNLQLHSIETIDAFL